MDLTPEQRRVIYEEEKAKTENKITSFLCRPVSKSTIVLSVGLFVFAFTILYSAFTPHSESLRSNNENTIAQEVEPDAVPVTPPKSATPFELAQKDYKEISIDADKYDDPSYLEGKEWEEPYREIQERLNAIGKESKDYKKAQSLKREIENDIVSMRIEHKSTAKSLRKEYATRLESMLLDKGMDATVSVSGPDLKTLTIKYILINRVFIHKMNQSEGFNQAMEKFKFAKVLMTNGYNNSWTYTF